MNEYMMQRPFSQGHGFLYGQMIGAQPSGNPYFDILSGLLSEMASFRKAYPRGKQTDGLPVTGYYYGFQDPMGSAYTRTAPPAPEQTQSYAAA